MNLAGFTGTHDRVLTNDPEIGITWPGIVGEYKGSAAADGYSLDGCKLNLSEKDQKWLGIKETFQF